MIVIAVLVGALLVWLAYAAGIAEGVDQEHARTLKWQRHAELLLRQYQDAVEDPSRLDGGVARLLADLDDDRRETSE